MAEFPLSHLQWLASLSRIVRPILFSSVLLVGLQRPTVVHAQAPLPEIVNLYQQAARNKNYIQAAQYAYEIATRYNEANEKDKVLGYLQQSVTHAKKSGDQALLHDALHQLGVVHSGNGRHAKALENFQSALTTARKLQNRELIKSDLINVSLSYEHLNKIKKSIEYAEEALSIAITDQDLMLQQECFQLLADYYDMEGNDIKSAEYLTRYHTLLKIKQNESLKEQKIQELEQHVQSAGREAQEAQAKLSEQNQRLLHRDASLRLIERSLRRTTDHLNATSDSLKQIEEVNKSKQMEIDLLEKDKELAGIKIREQEARIENEALIRNFVAVGSMLSIALVTVIIIGNRKKIKANRKIEEQNKNIRSSINYAKRIQEAMLPRPEQFPKALSESFVFFKPRDTVSGDFYWISEIKGEKGDDVAFAAVDCTGHGVPGAFMSMIGIKALNGLINRGVTQTNLILDELDLEIRTALRQEVSGNNDGMDIALCIYREREKVLEYSGAKSPLVYIQDHQLFKVKGDTHSIGGRRKDQSGFTFKKHRISIERPTVLYLFSDGYKDQFGGKDNTKFLSKKFNRLLLQIHELPMAEQMNILERAIDEWKGQIGQTDDILVIGLKLGY